MTVDDYLKTVKDLRVRCQRTADHADIGSERQVTYRRFVNELEKLADFLDTQARRIDPLPADLGDISDLPPELRQELSLPQADELEERIHAVLVSYGGTADLDQILIGLYRRFGEVQKRRFVQNKLYRMSRKSMVFSVPHKRGTYTINRPEEYEEPDSPLFPDDDDDSEVPF